jgi:hypothetical protein
MPFDSSPAFVVPAVETDEMLRVLIEARQWLAADPKRWAKCAYASGAMCAGNAVNDAARRLGFTLGSYYGDGWDALLKFVPAPFPTVGDYNDHPDTTHADVLALFDRAIAARRGELS